MNATLLEPQVDELDFEIRPTWLRLDPLYSTLSMLLSTLILNILPFITLTFLNFKILKIINKRRSSSGYVQRSVGSRQVRGSLRISVLFYT